MDKLKSLIEILYEQYGLYQEIFELEKQKTDVLVKGDSDKLDMLVNLEQAYIMQNSSLENKRTGILKELGIDEGQTVRDIIFAYQLEPMEELLRLVEDFYSLMNEIKKTNQLNQRLLRERLDIIEFIVRTDNEKKTLSAKEKFVDKTV